MTLLSLIIALLIEQVRPLSVQQLVVGPLRKLAGALVERFNDGQARNGRIAWVLVVVLATVACATAFFALWHMHPVLAFLFNIVVLYFTMGFRQESHFFTDIHLALRMGEIDRARTLLSEWRGGQYQEASSSEVARLAIEQALIASHRSVFGVAFWFVLLPGASGALMYRLARFFDDEWGSRTDNEFGSFGRFARQAFAVIDWMPARLTAASFSVAGDFEDAVFCWRTQAMLWPDKCSAILIASGAGALGVRLGMPIHISGEIVERPEMGLGDEADADYMQSTVGLVWRALVVCLVMLALLGLAGWVGG
ncbi:MAG: threonine-phosphate decarboxylase [Betaproteobacteria bacterium HGW-Betaproteobacteria-13]|uniref:Cobalamin biosynthesis protein CobD n=1 Tax=Parazoarcus communis TaxID=41977 RepID=A0A2U8H9Y2_9RHOO|nr:CobD/CbiB family protein [Parazoarcus communis]AWI81555.1 threonine-phosphate decarboxylase [Parazoarcus communis]PKO81800.1 MAG: threonine-phosphate decarboxylase [Betaproteobacteria bacterium HGW-Betaproteobacteria-13]